MTTSNTNNPNGIFLLLGDNSSVSECTECGAPVNEITLCICQRDDSAPVQQGFVPGLTLTEPVITTTSSRPGNECFVCGLLVGEGSEQCTCRN